MMWLSLLLDILFKPRESANFLMTRLIGYTSIFVGGLIGFYFLFHFLSSVIGYLETGALFCGFFLLVGGIFLILGDKKPQDPVNNLREEAQKILTNLGLEKVMKENGQMIILFSLFAGFVLSQIKEIKKTSKNN